MPAQKHILQHGGKCIWDFDDGTPFAKFSCCLRHHYQRLLDSAEQTHPLLLPKTGKVPAQGAQMPRFHFATWKQPRMVQLAAKMKSHHHTGPSELRAINGKILFFCLGEQVNLSVHWGAGLSGRTKLDVTKANKKLPALLSVSAVGTILGEHSL